MSPQIDRVLRAYERGQVTKHQVAEVLKQESTSIRFESLMEYYRRLWPEARLFTRPASIGVARVCPSQSQLSTRKHRLVRVLFDSRETFREVNDEFFIEYPISVLSLHDGRYAILDGHHRVLRWYELAGDEEPLRLRVLGTHNVELCENYRRQIESVARQTGSTHIRDLPML